MNQIYLDLCRLLVKHGKRVGNTLELSNMKFTLTDLDKNIISLKGRDISIPYMLGELIWYFKGDNTMKFISKFGKMWERLTDDGITNNSAYGYIIKEKQGFNQIDKVVELLTIDPSSRRAVININAANESVIETKDEPCTIALQFILRENLLYCTGIMRSNDIWFGTPYDVIFFTELQKHIAKRLGVDTGTYTHFVTSLHLYDKDYEQVRLMIESQDLIDVPTLNIEKLIENVDYLHSTLVDSVNPKEDVLTLCKEKGVI